MNKLGFGMLRLPLIDPGDQGSIDFEQLNTMVDLFIECGGRYFDTAYTYHDEKSEDAFKRAVAERYSHEIFEIADKMPTWKLSNSGDCEKYFYEQLGRCGVKYFDTYMLHWLSADSYQKAVTCKAFEFMKKMKVAGKIKRIGFSFHDTPETLECILNEQPCIDVVQLQINYLDWDNVAIASKQCYEVAKKHNKAVIVMEPIKGGTLAKLHPEAEKIFKEVNPNVSIASWALRFAAMLPLVQTVLSGMSNVEQVKENMCIMENMKPLLQKEKEAILSAVEIINSNTAVPCTACRYCTELCNMGVPIPEYFKLYNAIHREAGADPLWKIQPMYNELADKYVPASACIACRKCERHCPQHIKIAKFIQDVVKTFEECK